MLIKLLNKTSRNVILKVIAISSISAVFEMISAISLIIFVQFLVYGEKIDNSILKNFDYYNITLLDVILVALILVLFNFFLKIFSSYFLCKHINLLRTPISERLLQSIFSMQSRQYVDKSRSYYLSMLTWEVDHFIASVIIPIINIICSTISLVLITGSLMYMQPKITIIVLAVYSSAFLMFYFLTRARYIAYGERRLLSNNSRISLLNGILSDFKKIKVGNNLDNRILGYRVSAVNMSNNLAKLQFMGLINRPFIELITFTLLLLSTLYVALASDDLMHYAEFIGFSIIAAIKLLPQLQIIISSLSTVKSSRESIKSLIELDEINDYRPEFPYEPHLRPVDDKDLLLTIDNYRSGFSEQEKGAVNITLLKSSKIIISGKSGSGKTTLIDTILGLNRDPNLDIVINSNIISKGDISYLPQEIYLINSSIDCHLSRLKLEKAEHEKLKSIFFPEYMHDSSFFNRSVGDNGEALSGGQKQRLALMLTVATSPKLLILDESTNSLDPVLEKNIADFLYHEFTGAIIWVSHNTNKYNFENLNLDK